MTRKNRDLNEPSLSADEQKALKIAEIKDSLASRARTAEIRLLAVAKLETSHIALATALLSVKADIQVSWREFADLLGNIVGYAYLFKVANRGLYLKKTTFDLLRKNLISFAYEKLDMSLQIPTWNDSSDSSENE